MTFEAKKLFQTPQASISAIQGNPFVAPSVCYFQSKWWIANELGAGPEPVTVQVYSSTDGINYDLSHTFSTNYTGNRPRLVAYDHKLWLFYGTTTGMYSDTQFLYRVFDGSTWSDHSVLPNVSGEVKSELNVAASSDKLYFTYTLGGHPGTYSTHFMTYDGTNWSHQPLTIPSSCTISENTPSMVFHKGQLWVGGFTTTGALFVMPSWEGRFFFARFVATNGGSLECPVLASISGQLYFFYVTEKNIGHMQRQSIVQAQYSADGINHWTKPLEPNDCLDLNNPGFSIYNDGVNEKSVAVFYNDVGVGPFPIDSILYDYKSETALNGNAVKGKKMIAS